MNHANKQAARVALVTGAARRIGASIVELLHQAGFRVVIHCHRSEEAAQALASTLNQQCADSALVAPFDLLQKHTADKLVAETIEWAGRLDLLVNNASMFAPTDLKTFDDSAWDTLFAINVKAPFCLSRAAYPYLTKQEGSIINITDIHAEKPLKGYAVYCQSKAALTMQTKTLAREFAPHVRVNAIAPGAIAWPEHTNALNEQQQQDIIAKTPLKRHGDPLFIAQAVLAITENPFITGQTLRVDGGRALI